MGGEEDMNFGVKILSLIRFPLLPSLNGFYNKSAKDMINSNNFHPFISHIFFFQFSYTSCVTVPSSGYNSFSLHSYIDER